jgi:hypothetical protein
MARRFKSKEKIMKDQVRTCIQCGSEFEVAASEQERLLAKGFDIPKRCHACRKNKMKSAKENDKRGQRDKRKHDRSKDDYFF